MSVTHFGLLVVLLSTSVGVPIQRIVGSAPLSATSSHSHVCGATSVKAPAISLVVFSVCPIVYSSTVKMDMPVNVPVDDPNADTEWFVTVLILDNTCSTHNLGTTSYENTKSSQKSHQTQSQSFKKHSSKLRSASTRTVYRTKTSTT